MNRIARDRRLVWILMILLLLFDQATKVIVKTTMAINDAIMVFGSWFQIRFIENAGAAYGFELGGDYGKLALSLFRIVAIILLSVYLSKQVRKCAPISVIVGLTMVLAGAIGNMIDSIFYGLIFSESTPYSIAHFTQFGEGYTTFLHGKVVDMLYFPMIDTTLPSWLPIWGGERYIFFSPIFNVADSYITVGFVFLFLFCRNYFKESSDSSLK